MRKPTFPMAAGLALFATGASLTLMATAAANSLRQTPPQAIMLVNRMNSAYRSLQSYYDVASIKRKLDKKEVEATLTLAAQKPNRYLLELKGDHLNTILLSDGNTLIALRPDRKAYTKTKAPQQIIKSDLIGKVDMPSLGARIITQLLAANAREGEIGNLLLNAKVAGPQGFGDKLAYVFSFPYGEDTEARVYVTSGDYLVRQVKLVKAGEVEWLENHDAIQLDKPVPPDTFTRPLPDGSRMVDVLPPLDKPKEVASDDSGNATSGAGGSQAARAQAVYRANGCARCHGSGAAPDLRHEGADPAHTAQWIADHIRNPQTHNPGSRMPSFAGRISDQDIQTLAAYLAGLK